MKRIAALICCLLLMAAAAEGSRRRRHSGGAQHRAGQPGVFDYYLFVLSWSPQYCSNHQDPAQCAGNRKFSFVVHGLWPQYEHRWPQDCQPPSTVPSSLVETMLTIMPSPTLVQHEWDKHGTCSGLDQQAYFGLIQKLYAGTKIPPAYQQPLRNVVQSPAQIVQNFQQANPGFDGSSIKLTCSGRYLSEAQFCLDRNLKPRACSADVRDTCSAAEVILRPVR